ncbi:MAG: apolipoprotein N-acyltransferase [Proteobacteria bacterium]|nr:apolipoprotein N-acyltransferase [Pseudomonadota bacterium]
MRRLAAAGRSGLVPAGLGALAAAGQAPLGYWWMTLAALALLIRRVAQARDPRGRLWQGWTAGAGYFAASLFWIVEPFMVDAPRDGWMAPFALVFMAGGMALFWLLAAGIAGLGRSPAGRAAGFALGLAATDLLRGYVLTGFPWALLGHVWIGTPVAQAAAFTGPVGLSVLTVLAALGLALARRARPATALAAAGLVAAVWAAGAWRLAQTEAPRDPPIRVRLVQPNATQALKWLPGMWDEFIDRMMRATAAPQDRPLNLIVWPETSVPYLLGDSGQLLADATAAAGGVPLALGIQRAEGTRYFNSLAVTDAAGQLAAVYDKHHLVPFGEYVPLGDLAMAFGVKAFAAQAGNGYSAGPGPAILDLGRAGKVLPLICYEAVFPQDLRVPVRADWILQVTNDSWFGNLAGPWQHLAQARLRAIEQGLPLLRAANTGITAGFDAKGRVLGQIGLNREGWIDLDVPAALPPTLYARWGDWPVAVLLALGLLAVGLRRRRTD